MIKVGTLFVTGYGSNCILRRITRINKNHTYKMEYAFTRDFTRDNDYWNCSTENYDKEYIDKYFSNDSFGGKNSMYFGVSCKLRCELWNIEE